MMRDLSFDHRDAAMRSLPIAILSFAAVFAAHALIHDESPLRGVGSIATFGFAVVFVLTIVAHELIHVIAVVIAGALRWDDVECGVHWNTLTPYAHPRVPISARAYRLTAAAPGIVLGLVPAIAGLVSGSGPLASYGAFGLALACGDFLILFRIRHLPGRMLVMDHPSRVGCRVIA